MIFNLKRKKKMIELLFEGIYNLLPVAGWRAVSLKQYLITSEPAAISQNVLPVFLAG